MIDIQSDFDARNVGITKVGISEVKYPFKFTDVNAEQNQILETQTYGTFSLAASLQHQEKGTHMSRFLTSLYSFDRVFNLQKFAQLSKEIAKSLKSEKSFVEVEFPFFYEKSAPVSGMKGLSDVNVKIDISTTSTQILHQNIAVSIPIKSLCPCSKAISEFGAHSQRGVVTISIINSSKLSITNLIYIAEKSASSALYPVLKRVDEKFVTEQAYLKPRFVEDLTRECVVALREISSTLQFEVHCKNFESIHDHNAFALHIND